MATFESISASANSGAGSSSPTCTMSASAVVGSYAVAAVTSGGNTANQPLSVSSGSGEQWEFLSAIPQGSTLWLSFFGKRVSTADISAAVNCTLAGGGAHYDMAVATYSSCDGVDGILWNVVGGAGSTTISPQSIRPRFDSQTVVCIIGCSGTAAASAIATPSTSYTSRYDDCSAATSWKELFIQDRTLGAGTGWITETPSNLTNSQLVTVAVATITLLNTGQRRSTARPPVVPAPFLRLRRQQRFGIPTATAAFTQTVTAVEAPARALGQAVVASRLVVEAASISRNAVLAATRAVSEAPARALAAAVTATRTAVEAPAVSRTVIISATRAVTEAPARLLRAAVTATVKATQGPAGRTSQAGAKTVTVTETPGRALAAAVSATRVATEIPARVLQAAITATRKVTETVAPSAQSTVARLQTVTAVETTIARVTSAVTATRPVVETVTRRTLEAIASTISVAQAPARRVSAAVTAARTATQVPARIVKAAVTASLKTTEASAPGSVQGTARTVTVTETPARALRAAVGAARAVVEAATPKRSATAVTATRAVLEQPAGRLLAAIARSYRATTAPIARVRASIGNRVRATVGYLFKLVNSKGQGHQAPDRFVARLDGPPWTARANDTAWSAAARTRGGLMYHQLAVSDTAIPVLITSKFGLDPTGDPVVYAVLDPTDPAPAQGDIQLQATWYTDPDGKHWAMCPAGPNSTYVPDPGTVKALYVMIGDATNVVCDPVTVRFD